MTEPDFILRDGGAITTEMLAQFEALTGKTLYPAQVDRLWIDFIAYRETLTRIAANEAAKQNLLAFASGSNLGDLGELLGVSRQTPKAARCIVQIRFKAAVAEPFVIPTGWRVATGGTGMVFATEAAVAVPAGSISTDVTVVAEVAGTSGNGYIAGQVNTVIDALATQIDTVTNINVSSGGAEAQGDESLRAAIRLAPESFSWGSANRYRVLAMETDASLIDVQVTSPTPDGAVLVVLLGRNGVPDAQTVARVQAACTDPAKRMLGDRVTVRAASAIDYQVDCVLDVMTSAVSDRVLSAAQSALENAVAQRARVLGADLVPSQFQAVLGGIPGIYDCHFAAPLFRELAAHEWAHCTSVRVRLEKLVSNG